ncbi:hypothetical protein CCMA1212_004234 [Trichoderma ghanense]|uniref:Uncharacterized protein n=1 Tax=Trichoderma ghanense TaxID=65468 RepID=A0ABY2H711_9HYPO
MTDPSLYRYLQTPHHLKAVVTLSRSRSNLASAPPPNPRLGLLPPSLFQRNLDSVIPPRSDKSKYGYVNTCAFPVLPR